MSRLAYSPACERNREPILAVLGEVFSDRRSVLEVGSGTGQHAVFFAAALSPLVWHTSDLPEHHAGILGWIRESGLENVRAPLPLDVSDTPWPALPPVDAAFSANTAHIMGWDAVCDMFAGLGERLPPEAPFCLYGPFNRAGRFTSESNREFDASLRLRDPRMGIRDLGLLEKLAADTGFVLAADHAMPANNALLVWRRTKKTPPEGGVETR